MSVIAFTHETGTNGTQIARKVAVSLGLLAADRQFLEDRLVERLDDHLAWSGTPGDGQLVFGPATRIDQRQLARAAEDEIRELTAYGSVLMRGWGAATMLRDTPSVVRVRISAPREFRAKVLASRHPEWCLSQIHQEIDGKDACLATNLEPVLGPGWRTAGDYHLTIDTQKLDVTAAALLIEELVRPRSKSSSPASRLDRAQIRSA